MSTIHEASAGYERWLGARLDVVRADLRYKHARMRESAFVFLRGSFFHWAHQWKTWCPDLADAPTVVAVGDVHVENFGTWRDAEGRLVWGVNDFDEAWPLPYTSDLLRLATSARLAGLERELSLDENAISAAIARGYTEGLEAGGRPFVLAEGHDALRRLAVARLRDPETFWAKLASAAPLRGGGTSGASGILEGDLPPGSTDVRWYRRRAGVGSLGRPRITAVATWQGASVAREAKAIAPSACAWVDGRSGPRRRWHRKLLHHPFRCLDPFVQLRGSWVVRRLAPDCSRIDLTDLDKDGDEDRLLEAMGREVANVHLATGRRKAILRDLYSRDPDWLRDATRRAVKAVRRAYAEWSEP
jgi:hypothetical protein